MTVARLIGYWRQDLPPLDLALSEEQTRAYERQRDYDRGWPDARAFVDHTWDPETRASVAHHLQRATLVNQYRGLSPCRLCDRHNGSAEFTDGAYCWPEGLAHYVVEHGVRLPDEFADHVLQQPAAPVGEPEPMFDELGMRDRAWPGAEHEGRLWQPDDADPFGITIDVDPTWWRGLAEAGGSGERR